MDSFNENLRESNFSSDSPTIIDQYKKTLENTLQKHAPLKRRIITLRPSAPWYNEEIGKASEKTACSRRLERR
ncbi:Hypothetical predicted protein [Paramuricea clavata]|uniref:Uncharacterized protein n=1 Tax=Paramuricea clavata TaxID=317549 RepID=A0A6S7J0N8_PARCT|nr:Hypothetical predicted protein [Paramuricea clavata]